MRTTAETTGVACRGSHTYTRTTPFAAPDAAPASAHVMARTEHELVDMDGWAP